MPPPNTKEFDIFNYDGEKDGDEDEEDQYEEEKQDLFWNMPPLLSQQEQEPEFTTQTPTTYRVRSFVQHCRPVIIVDGAHLKAGYSGTNLVAIAMDELTFVSDRAASIAHGVSTVFPEAFHCFCARHLFGSIKTKSNKFKYFEWHYWKMVKAYRGSDFEDHLSSVSLTSTVTPYAERKLGKRTRKSRRWQAIPSTNNLIEVRDGRKNGMVNLDDKVCSCGQWQLSGIPCGHVIAAARLFGVEDVTKFVSHWFTTQTYINTYLEHIIPLPHRSEWSYPSPGVLQIVNPPIKEKRAPGRPKSTKRIPSKGEDTEKTVRTCTRCKEPGHGRDTCTASYDRTGESTSKRVVKTSASKSKKGKEKATDAEAFKAY
ncbi:uncharacterized protein [Rutidosis leptorrhynchoides]|uniref:uncharacterized protein n=1 Tax=Rutidosis leptorrhynchoides TaxID=125765 RepID=UPI003A99E887